MPSPPAPDTGGVLSAFAQHARASPDRTALVITSPGDGGVSERVTYGELLSRAESFAAGLGKVRTRTGQTLASAAPPSVDSYALALAVLGSGMQLGLIDGGLERRRILRALRAARPRAIVGTAELLRSWPLAPSLWRARRYAVDGPAGLGVRGVGELAAVERAPLRPGRPEDPAILSFSSGRTGRARGVLETNGILLAQHRALSANVPFLAGDVDMTCFPAAVLHNLAGGVTTVLAPVELRAPARIDPALALEVIAAHGVTSVSAAPAFVSRLCRAVAGREAPPTLRQIVLGGAPVSRALCHRLAQTFPDTLVTIVYGSTEAEPISHVSARELLAEAEEGSWREPVGLLVGAPVGGVRAEVVTLPERVRERVTEGWIEARRTPVGEIVVYGPNVSRLYVGDRDATARNKLRLKDGAVWHRTGDLGRIDAHGRLRLLGRVGDGVDYRGTTVFPLPLEARLAAVRGVRRVGLVEVKARAVLAVELDPGASLAAVRARLEALGLGALKVRAVAEIPVDARHQSTLDRPALVRLLSEKA